MDAAPGPPRVSVIVRTKDRPGLLREALDSLRQQTVSDFEVLLVNDGGTPPSRDVLEPAPGCGLTVLGRTAPHGRARALNAALEAARGRYIAYLDDDDLFKPDHLGALAGFLDGSDRYRVVYADVEQVEQTLGEDGRYHGARLRFVFARDFDPGRLIFSNYIPLIGVMHHRALIEVAGAFDESFDLFEDWDFLVRLARVTPFHRIPRVTATYRVRNDGSNATSESPWLGAAAQAARRHLLTKHQALHSPEALMSLVDAFEREAREREAAIRGKDEEIRGAREEVRGGEERYARLSEELRAFRADAARQLQAAGEREAALRRELGDAGGRETALRGELDAARQTLHAIYTSKVWRLFGPYWKLKERLGR